MWKRFKKLLQEAGVLSIFCLLRCVSVDTSARWIAFLARHIGPYLSVTRIADKNIQKAFPHVSEKQRKQIIIGMWDNLGRVAGEFPHIKTFMQQPCRFETEGIEAVEGALRKGQPVIFFSGHYGNWEVSYLPLSQKNYPINLLGIDHGAPLINFLLDSNRINQNVRMIIKGRTGTRNLIKAIQNGEVIGALVDQYAGDGQMLPLFDMPAKTPLGLAKLAVRYKTLFVPVQVIRKGRTSRFKVIFHPAIDIPEASDQTRAAMIMMQQAHHYFEEWVRNHPEQWLWLHNRWKQKHKKEKKNSSM